MQWNPLPACLKRLKRTGPVCLVRGLWFDGSTVKKDEPDVWEFMNANIARGWHCVDVGANRGEYTFLMAKLAGASGFVHAFELHSENARTARYNTARFRDRRKVENLAVTNGKNPVAEVFSGRSDAEWSLVGLTNTTGKALFSVPATSLDQYFNGNGKLDLVKIDVEGAGGEVLAGMRRILAQVRPLVVFEVHSQKEWEGRRYLLEAGYSICTMRGKTLDKVPEFVFRCLAVPEDKSGRYCS